MKITIVLTLMKIVVESHNPKTYNVQILAMLSKKFKKTSSYHQHCRTKCNAGRYIYIYIYTYIQIYIYTYIYIERERERERYRERERERREI